jgi:hypothetical protein
MSSTQSAVMIKIVLLETIWFDWEKNPILLLLYLKSECRIFHIEMQMYCVILLFITVHTFFCNNTVCFDKSFFFCNTVCFDKSVCRHIFKSYLRVTGKFSESSLRLLVNWWIIIETSGESSLSAKEMQVLYTST